MACGVVWCGVLWYGVDTDYTEWGITQPRCSGCCQPHGHERSNKEKSKQYYQDNKERLVKQQKQYYQDNKEECKKQQKQYRQDNKEKIAKRQRQYEKKRRANDPAYRMIRNLRKGLWKAMSGNSKPKKTMELLGCSKEHLEHHLEAQFTDGMTWDNIHIDHIQPCASFDLEDPIEQQRCFHYTNLQPLFAEDNLRKSDSIVPEHQVNLL